MRFKSSARSMNRPPALVQTIVAGQSVTLTWHGRAKPPSPQVSRLSSILSRSRALSLPCASPFGRFRSAHAGHAESRPWDLSRFRVAFIRFRHTLVRLRGTTSRLSDTTGDSRAAPVSFRVPTTSSRAVPISFRATTTSFRATTTSSRAAPVSFRATTTSFRAAPVSSRASTTSFHAAPISSQATPTSFRTTAISSRALTVSSRTTPTGSRAAAMSSRTTPISSRSTANPLKSKDMSSNTTAMRSRSSGRALALGLNECPQAREGLPAPRCLIPRHRKPLREASKKTYFSYVRFASAATNY
jgi:hypothetical protein